MASDGQAGLRPQDFVRKWQDAHLKERSAAQEHFLDLCRLIGEPSPAQADPEGHWYAFEFGAAKAGGGTGWADVWRRGCFGWEYKGKDLQVAFRQLQLYAPALEYPPLLVVCDLQSIVIHTAFTGTPRETHVLTLEDLATPEGLKPLRWLFREPERFHPGVTTQEITAKAAGRFADLAQVRLWPPVWSMEGAQRFEALPILASTEKSLLAPSGGLYGLPAGGG